MKTFLLTLFALIVMITPSYASGFSDFDDENPYIMTCWNSDSFMSMEIQKQGDDFVFYNKGRKAMSIDIIEVDKENDRFIATFGVHATYMLDFKNKKLHYKNDMKQGRYDCS